ncbi:MSRB1 [Cervus elaphus hippelaphus]|uniref:Methionine-R-sulfoxide reductase B1 n=1 Tax=Cervus elaphus hippelaphus TaxID=46360 RepID=A0A212CYL0_CEREH|nr:MSRB1 [Cervus elaphus hippelaphus]
MSFCSFFGGEIFQNHFEPGIYVCAKCGYELFSSRSKYAHSSPWPAFTETIHADSVAKRPEHNRPGAIKLQGPTICLFQASGLSLGSCHPELLRDPGALVSCGRCGNGLGHEFLNDGPKRGQSRF